MLRYSWECLSRHGTPPGARYLARYVQGFVADSHLLGKPVRKRYHSHYVITSRDGLVYDHAFDQKDSKKEEDEARKNVKEERKEKSPHKLPKAYDEFVFFHESQVAQILWLFSQSNFRFFQHI